MLLELLGALALVAALLAARVLEASSRARRRALERRRLQAYFLARALAAELPLSERPPRIRNVAVRELLGVRRDLARMGAPAAAVRSLEGLRIDVRPREPGGLCILVVGPGVRERRLTGGPS